LPAVKGVRPYVGEAKRGKGAGGRETSGIKSTKLKLAVLCGSTETISVVETSGMQDRGKCWRRGKNSGKGGKTRVRERRPTLSGVLKRDQQRNKELTL